MVLAVTAWTGSVGGYVMSQSVADDRPAYATGSNADAVAMGASSITFDGTNDELSIHGLNNLLATMPISSSEYSILSYQSVKPTSNDAIWGFGDNSDTYTLQNRYASSIGKFKITGQGPNMNLSSSLTGSGMVTAFTDDGTNATYTLNNVTSSETATISFSGAALDALTFGSTGQATKGDWLSGSITEIMFVSRSLQVAEIEGYKRHVLKNYLNPTNIGGLQHRWRADSGVTLNAGTQEAFSWTDSISNQTMLGLVAGNFEPVYTTFLEGFANNRSYMTASTTSDVFNSNVAGDTTSAVSSSFTGDHTLVSIFHKGKLGTEEAIMDYYYPFDDNTPDDRFKLNTNASDVIAYTSKGGGLNTTFADTTVLSSSNLLVVSCVAFQMAGTVNFVTNGTEASVTSTARTFTFTPTGSNFQLMNRVGAGRAPSALFEFMIFNRALSFAEMQNLTSYARLYYGLEG